MSNLETYQKSGRFKSGHVGKNAPMPCLTKVNLCVILVSDWLLGSPNFTEVHPVVTFKHAQSDIHPVHVENVAERYTPWKINMEPTNHPFRKENDLLDLHDYVPC